MRITNIVRSLAIASLLFALPLSIRHMVKAESYTIATPNGSACTLTIKNYENSDTANFSFTDPDDLIQGLGVGELHVFGIFNTDNFEASPIQASFTDTATDDTKTLIDFGAGIFDFDLLTNAPVFTLYAHDDDSYLTYSTTSLVFAGTDLTPPDNLPFTYSTGGGSYTGPTPEMSSGLALGVLLAVGLCFFVIPGSTFRRHAKGWNQG